MIDDRNHQFSEHRVDLISHWCDRRFGIGADGVILIRDHAKYDFEMVYFNPDGSQSLCGNGSRCAVKFAKSLAMVSDRCEFLAVDGPHTASIEGDMVNVKLHDVGPPQNTEDGYFINTGSPHHIKIVEALSDVDVMAEGSTIRYGDPYQPSGTNVNFVQPEEKQVLVRTYERGVENETLSCGTGVTAVALVMGARGLTSPVNVKAVGGNLEVSFNKEADGSYTEIYLSGPAEKVFEGKISF